MLYGTQTNYTWVKWLMQHMFHHSYIICINGFFFNKHQNASKPEIIILSYSFTIIDILLINEQRNEILKYILKYIKIPLFTASIPVMVSYKWGYSISNASIKWLKPFGPLVVRTSINFSAFCCLDVPDLIIWESSSSNVYLYHPSLVSNWEFKLLIFNFPS